MLFGSYRINDPKNAKPRLSLQFSKGGTGPSGELDFYACAVKRIDEPLDEVYDWSADLLSKKWSAKKALEKLEEHPNTLVCDALLDQSIFSGAGNIIKNEVLFRIKVHPKNRVGKLPLAKKKELIKEAAAYSRDFLRWKKKSILKEHWQAHTKTICPRDSHKIRKEYLGKTNRRTYFCTACQKLY